MQLSQLAFVFTIAILLHATNSQVLSDGPKDNMPDQVRRVPPLGIEVSPEKREQLETQLQLLRDKIDEVAADHPGMAERLPDIEILYRAVHDALEYQEFFKKGEIEEALSLLQLAENRVADLERDLKLSKVAKQAGKEMENEHPPMPAWLKSSRSRLMVRGFRSKIDHTVCLLYTSPSPRDQRGSRMPSSA